MKNYLGGINMNKELRKKYIEDIQKQEPYMTGIRIRYNGEIREFKAYKIRLEYLVYNKYNGRIGSVVKSFEKENRVLNPELVEDKIIIENFLFGSKVDRNNSTMQDLVKNMQQEYGMITIDGTIIDGNRRASLLNRIYSNREIWEKKGNNVDHAQFFIAIILPEESDQKEIIRLETTYQLGKDEKLDYNPIEKYLKCKDLLEFWTVSDIAKMMDEKEKVIEQYLKILELMEEYLQYFGYDGIYTRLEKREDQFIQLWNYLNSYKSGSKTVMWEYQDEDILDLQSVCFDYIRAEYEGKDFRKIMNTKDGFFVKEDTWKNFYNHHIETVQKVTEIEESIEEQRKKYPGSPLSKLLSQRDEEWKKNVISDMKSNMSAAQNSIDNERDTKKPAELLRKALDTVNKIDLSYLDENCTELLEQMIVRIDYMKKKLDN
jgi:hypothetical protein